MIEGDLDTIIDDLSFCLPKERETAINENGSENESRTFLIFIDCQNDFFSGKLANEFAKNTVNALMEAAEYAKKKGFEMIFTLDTHQREIYFNSQEGVTIPEHCLENTEGWEIIPELQKYTKNALLIKKDHFLFENWREYIREGDRVFICGTLSEVCVISNALTIRAIENVDVVILDNCCSALSDDKQKAAMSVMMSCKCNVRDHF